MLRSSFSRIFFAVFLISFLCYTCFSKNAVGVALGIPDMESSDESHIAKREITSRKEKKKLKRKLKRLKHKQQLEKDDNLERKESGRKEKGRDIKRKERKKKIPKKKTFKQKRKRWHKSKKVQKKGESKEQAVAREETDCISTLFKYSNLNNKKVPTIIKQVKLIEKGFGALEKKLGKKEAFRNHFLALEAALSDCNRTNNQSVANQTIKPTNVLHTLGNCSIEIEKRCSNTLNNKLKATLSNFNEVAVRFAKQMKDCSNSSLSTDESCACLEDINMFDVDKVQECNLNDEKAEAIGYKSACLKTVSVCKSAAVDSAIVIHNCHLDEKEPLLRLRAFSALVTNISNWNNVKTISKSPQTVTCCDHETEEGEKAECGQFLDCESICMSKGKSVCPTGICTSDRYDCDPEGGEYIEDPLNETEDCDCKDCPVTDCPNCCYNEKCRKLKPKTCKLKLTAFSGNVWSSLYHIHTLTVDKTR